MKCRCDTLPADFSVGIGHARACPMHAYEEPGGVSPAPAGKSCRVCGRPESDHKTDSVDNSQIRL